MALLRLWHGFLLLQVVPCPSLGAEMVFESRGTTTLIARHWLLSCNSTYPSKFPLVCCATVISTSFNAKRVSKTDGEWRCKASLARSALMPLVAYVSKNTCVERMPRHNASLWVAGRKTITSFKADEMVRKHGGTLCKDFLARLPPVASRFAQQHHNDKRRV
jgi:hypothetical protein